LRRVLLVAACIGVHFNVAELTVLLQSSAEQTADALATLVDAAYIFQLSPSLYKVGTPLRRLTNQSADPLKFCHDSVRTAAYAILPDVEKQKLHLRLGQLLLASEAPEVLEENLFEVVGHFNWCIPCMCFVTPAATYTVLLAAPQRI
jgi:predicted ATPase